MAGEPSVEWNWKLLCHSEFSPRVPCRRGINHQGVWLWDVGLAPNPGEIRPFLQTVCCLVGSSDGGRGFRTPGQIAERPQSCQPAPKHPSFSWQRSPWRTNRRGEWDCFWTRVRWWAMPRGAKPAPCNQSGFCLNHPAKNRDKSTFHHQDAPECKYIQDLKVLRRHSDQGCNTGI